MSQSFVLLRNQLNESYEFIRPLTSKSIIRAISAIEISCVETGIEENTILPLSTLITRLRGGLDDFQAVSQFLDNPSTSTSVCLPIFRELIAELFIS